MIDIFEIETLATEIGRLIVKEGIDLDATMYFNNMRHIYKGNRMYDIEYDVNVDDYVKYHGDILTITFEGALYEIMNGYCPDNGFLKKFEAILDKYNLCYEMGDAWNLSLYER